VRNRVLAVNADAGTLEDLVRYIRGFDTPGPARAFAEVFEQRDRDGVGFLA
jgi:hypothetical protein